MLQAPIPDVQSFTQFCYVNILYGKYGYSNLRDGQINATGNVGYFANAQGEQTKASNLLMS